MTKRSPVDTVGESQFTSENLRQVAWQVDLIENGQYLFKDMCQMLENRSINPLYIADVITRSDSPGGEWTIAQS